MSRGMTKKACLAFEKLAIEEISKILGDPETYLDDHLEWNFPFGDTGTVSLHLFCDSKEKGNVYRSSWIAGRLNDRQRLVGEDGYTKSRNEIEGGWPFPFTYPSGKYNLHPGDKDDIKTMRKDLIAYLSSIVPQKD